MEKRLLGKTSDSGYTFNRLTGGVGLVINSRKLLHQEIPEIIWETV